MNQQVKPSVVFTPLINTFGWKISGNLPKQEKEIPI